MKRHDLHARRRDSVRTRLAQEGVDALLITHAANRFYLSGFELHDPQCNESAGALLLTQQGEDWILTDPRYEEAAKRIWPSERVFIARGKQGERYGEFLRDQVRGTVGIESAAVSYFFYSTLKEYVSLKPTQKIVESVRILKEEQELVLLEKSCALNHRTMQWVEEELLRPGMTEEQAAWEIEKYFRENGASELAFSGIVAVGVNGALPHAVPGDVPIYEDSPVLVDVGARLAGYCSDQTRTFWVGNKPSPEFLRTRALVQDAQQAAIDRMRPGMEYREAYEIAKEFFRKNRVEEFFTHALGHGIGLETHELPSLNPFAQGVLETGMVVTVEPGLYYTSWGGVRWEYMVQITETGARIL